MSPSGKEKQGGQPTVIKAGYGFSEVGLSALELMLQVYLLELYVVAGLSPLLAGIALAIAALWDAVSDPLMGSISDKTDGASPRRKRLSYFIPGVALAFFSFVMLFSPSSGSEESVLFARLLMAYLFLNTALTLVNVPYLALINDLSPSEQDRAGFFGWRLSFSGMGLLVGLSLPSAVAYFKGVSLEGDGIVAFLDNRSAVALLVAWVMVGACAVSVLSLWKVTGKSRTRESQGPGLKAVALIALKSLGFRNIVLAFVFISMGRAVNASLALLFYKGTLAFAEGQVALALVALAVTIMIATPFWVLGAKRLDKRRLCFYGSVGLTILTAVAYPLMPPGGVLPLLLVVFLGGALVASVVLLESLFSDIIEGDSVEADKALSGSYYGLWRLSTKVARAGGLAFSGLFLSVVGYREGAATQTDFVERSIAWAFGPGVAVFFGVGAWFIWREFKRSGEANQA